MNNLLNKIDDFQQRHPGVAFPFAVFTKFNDDQAGSQAALIAYYAFLSLFPLLLVFLTILQFVIGNNPEARDKIIHAALSAVPSVGAQLQNNVHELHGSVFALVVGIILTLFGALGIANALQNAFNHVWRVPITDRPNGPAQYGRSLLLIIDIGLGTIISSAITSYGAGSHLHIVARIGVLLLGLIINAVIFLFAFQIGTAPQIKRSDLTTGAIIAACAWMVLQAVGSLLVLHQIHHASALYGTFALVLGMIGWLYLQAQITVYAMEINVVKSRKLWPRSLTKPPLTPEDKRAYRLYAKSEQRTSGEQVDVHFDPPAEPEAAEPEAAGNEKPPELTKRSFIDAALILIPTVFLTIFRHRKRK